MSIHPHIKAKSEPEWTSLYDHLMHVSESAICFAEYLDMDTRLARIGGVLHDIGKAQPIFQKRLRGGKSTQTFRHEIASLFFLPLFEREDWPTLTEMIVAHHKSVYEDARLKGILDLEQQESDPFKYHLGDWEWHFQALDILSVFGFNTRPIHIDEVAEAYKWVIDFCDLEVRKDGYSEWRGLLVGADHFASALIDETQAYLPRMFQKPNLIAFERKSKRFPLSLKDAHSSKRHTLVVASTGAGKTDYLFRRCRGRVFYMLPFQASINAMYYRLQEFLGHDNPDLELRVKHGASKLMANATGTGSKDAEIAIQSLFGASVKVLTPFQVAAIALACKGYESVLLDIQGCDVIMDEVHTYSGTAQGIVLKVVEVLTSIGCRIHVGTATMPTILFEGVREILGKKETLEVRLSADELSQYNRHTVIKSTASRADAEGNFNVSAYLDHPEVTKILARNGKVLLVANQVSHAQEIFQVASARWPTVPILLLHSRYKRGDRGALERRLIGLDNEGIPTGQFNTSTDSCIVVSTQVVEVSIDISFDLLVTDCAPLDSLVQRFGRINRKRLHERQSVIVLAPPEIEKAALPYDLEILRNTYDTLPEGPLNERDVQGLLDRVYPELLLSNINNHSAYKDGQWQLGRLMNYNSKLIELLDVDSVACIIDSDIEAYLDARGAGRMPFEISLRYWTVKDLPRLEYGSKPFVVASEAYSQELGLRTELIHNTQTFL